MKKIKIVFQQNSMDKEQCLKFFAYVICLPEGISH